MGSYCYDNIVDSDHAIRVLTLSPGREKDPLRGKLETCRLDRTLAYDGLSYCWGVGEKNAVMDCSQGSIPITKTLECALRVLRHEDKTRRLWIDQICINQDSNAERSSQVRLMYEIYSLAQRTIVWLGEDEQEHGPVVRKLFNDFQTIGADCQNHGFSITTPPDTLNPCPVGLVTEQVKWDEEDRKMTINEESQWFPMDNVLEQCRLPRRSSEAWRAFNALLRSRYFTRVWTLQEVLSGRETTIIWGTTELTWASLRVAYRWAVLDNCLTRDPRIFSFSPCLERVRFLELELDWFRGLRFRRLADLVTTAREGLQATDPRDQIYAFISLASDGQDFEIDYDKSEEHVLRDFAKHCILQCGNLTMLNFAGLHRDDSFRLPSWVPGWSSRPLFWNTTCWDSFFTVTLNGPLVPLAGEDRSTTRRSCYDWKSEGCLADRPDQLLIKGYRLPRDQAKIVCTRQAYSEEDPHFVPIVAQYHELCHTSVSPSIFLREMVKCMTSADRHLRFDDHELLAQLISFITSSIFYKDSTGGRKNLKQFVPGLEMIGLAADAIESCGIPTNSFSSGRVDSTQSFTQSLVREASSEGTSQKEPDKVSKAILENWKTERRARFNTSWKVTGTGRKLFVTTQGRVGIGPAPMTTNDVIIIAYGGDTPYVLRRVPGTQEYLLLGDCYIANLMDGTAIPKDDDPPAEWFCLGGVPRQTIDFAISSSGTKDGEGKPLTLDLDYPIIVP